ncbi:MAG TPA: tetratricopeptide repeat protein [Ktedonobacteraceae bacterium]|nr:tetratricopeptide repeat protein [Ktedonobacteraceae bacterium]
MARNGQGKPNDILKRERLLRGWTQGELAGRIGTDGYTVNRWERGRALPGPYFRRQLCEMFGKNVEELGLLSETLQTGAAEPSFPVIWLMPYRRNLFFAGREALLSALNQSFRTKMGQAQAISGLGGIGKTQTAIEYAYRYHQEYAAVLWLGADSRTALLANFTQLAKVLNLVEQHEKDQQMLVAAVKRWLQEHPRWLLVLDNVEDLERANDFIPTLHGGNVLMTTRVQSTGAAAHSIELERMTPEEGALFLLHRAKIVAADLTLEQAPDAELRASGELSRLMDGLPLALDQAAAYIEETGCGAARYLEHYRSSSGRAGMLALRGSSADHPASVATTWSLSFEKVSQSNAAAAEVLQYCAFLHADDIPEELFSGKATDLETDPRQVIADSLRFDAISSELRKYSLIRRHPESSTLSMHRLVQVILRESMEPETRRQRVEQLVSTLNRLFPRTEVEFSSWEHCQRYLMHILECAPFIEEMRIVTPEAGHLLNRTAIYLHEHAEYEQAEHLYRQALDIRIAALGAEHPDVAETLDWLASLYEYRWQDAEPFYQRALEIRLQSLGTTHPDVAESLNNLALFYQKRSQLRRAEALYLQAVEILEQPAGQEDVRIARLLSNLAALYHEQGRYAEAEVAYRRSLAICERTLGPDHYLVSISLRLLGVLYHEKGNYAQAEAFHRRGLALREQSLGPHHPYVAACLSDLAALYLDQGRYAQSEALYQRALSIREQSLGPHNPYVARTLRGMAELAVAQEKLLQAEHLFNRALSIWEHSPDPAGLDVAYTLNSFATLLRLQGKYSQAEEVATRALDIRTRTLGKKHLHVAQSLNTLAAIYHAQGRNAEAAAFYKHAFTIARQVAGTEHPYAVASLQGLANVYRSQGRFEQAELLHWQTPTDERLPNEVE